MTESCGTMQEKTAQARAPRRQAAEGVRDGAGKAPARGRHAAKPNTATTKRASGNAPAGASSSRRKRRRAKARRRVAWRICLSVLTVIGVVLVTALGAGLVAFRGPSRSLGDLLTVTMLETSALKFVPRIYYSQAAVQAQPTPPPENLNTSEEGIESYEVHGATYNGWMMVVQDPSRVGVGVCREQFSSKPGLRLHEIAERYGGVAAVNGGGFSDSGGLGNGGRPLGLVISSGEVLNKADIDSDHAIVVGFNQDNVLLVGKMTSTEALEKGMRDALAFGPALVVNGEAARVSGSSSGLNPRTAIGQRADGAVLLLVIDGRQASSLGATYADLISVMVEYGAVNAVNLDGGSSSLMYYKGEYLNKGVILTGSRDIPTAFVVR